MMWLAVVTLVLGAGPDSTRAEDLFKKMEARVLKCKTIQTALDTSVVTGAKTIFTGNGRLLVAEGDRVRLELAGQARGMDDKITMISDGKHQRSMSMSTQFRGKDQETTKDLGNLVAGCLSRTGIFLMAITMSSERPAANEALDLDKILAMSDFKLGKKEMIDGSEAQSIEYKLALKRAKEAVEVTTWIDVKTGLPVKRVVILPAGFVIVPDSKEKVTITETYSKLMLDQKVAADEFILPK